MDTKEKWNGSFSERREWLHENCADDPELFAEGYRLLLTEAIEADKLAGILPDSFEDWDSSLGNPYIFN